MSLPEKQEIQEIFVNLNESPYGRLETGKALAGVQHVVCRIELVKKSKWRVRLVRGKINELINAAEKAGLQISFPEVNVELDL